MPEKSPQDGVRTRVVIRKIPDFVTPEELNERLKNYGEGEVFTLEYVAPPLPVAMQSTIESFGRAYLRFTDPKSVGEFKEFFEKETFCNEQSDGRECAVEIEWAPLQSTERHFKKPERDKRIGQVFDMPNYKKFLQQLERDEERLLEQNKVTDFDPYANDKNPFGMEVDLDILEETNETNKETELSAIVKYLVEKKRKERQEREYQAKRKKELKKKRQRERRDRERREKERRRYKEKLKEKEKRDQKKKKDESLKKKQDAENAKAQKEVMGSSQKDEDVNDGKDYQIRSPKFKRRR